MLNFFKSNRPYNSFLLFVYALLLCWSVLGKPFHFVVSAGDGFGWHMLMSMFSFKAGFGSMAFTVFFMSLLIIQAIMINSVSIVQRLFTRVHYITGMAFLLLLSLFVYRHSFSSSLLASTLLLSLLNKTASLQNTSNPKTDIFNIALGFGLSTAFFTPSIWFITVFMLSMLISRPFKLNEWLLMGVGLLTPYYFFISISFLSGKSIPAGTFSYLMYAPKFTFALSESIALIMLLILLAAGIFYVQSNMRRLLVQSRKTWSLLYLWLIVGAIIPFFNKDVQFSDFIFMLPPAAAFLSAFFFYQPKPWLSAVLHWVLLALSIVNGFGSVFK